ncbi:hypothetical protein MMC13_007301 [Lambiella insularis]|nr:hypothetical protein [Lambiella insularis]
MSSTAPSITPARFAAALPSLPLSSLHAKAAELRNSIAHLEASNQQLHAFAVQGDRECAEAIRENEEVVERMLMRIELLRAEVVGRGFLWGEGSRDGEGKEMGEEDGGVNGGAELLRGVRAAVNGASGGRQGGGTLGDEELARRLRERMEEGDDGEGLHL